MDVAKNAGTMTGKSVIVELDQEAVIIIGGVLPTMEDAIAVAVAEARIEPTAKAKKLVKFSIVFIIYYIFSNK